MQIEELPGNFPARTQRQELARERRAGRSQAKEMLQHLSSGGKVF